MKARLVCLDLLPRAVTSDAAAVITASNCLMPSPRKSATKKIRHDPVVEGAVPADELKGEFPPINLPIQPPYPPMEAKSVEELPRGEGWQYEPKWDGFRCLAFR